MFRAHIEIERERTAPRPSEFEWGAPSVGITRRLRWTPMATVDETAPHHTLTFVSHGSEGVDGHLISMSIWREERDSGGVREWDVETPYRDAIETLWRQMTGEWTADRVTLESDLRPDGPDEPGRTWTGGVRQLRVAFGGARPDLVFESLSDDEYSPRTYRAIVDGEPQKLLRAGQPDYDLEKALEVWDGRLAAGSFYYDTDDTQY